MFHRRRRGREKGEGQGGMRGLGALLARYRAHLRPPQSAVVDAFCFAVKEELGYTLEHQTVRYEVRTRTISVRATGALKSELALRKAKLLARLRRVLGTQHAPEHIV